MKKKCYRDIQRQVTCLIPIMEFCIALIAETELTKNKLNTLPKKLENLKKQLDSFNFKPSQNSIYTSPTQLREMEFKMDSLVDDIEVVFTSLAIFDSKLKNVIALKEKFEAIQQERIDGITPERVYKLLEKQQRSQYDSFISSSEIPQNNFLLSINNKIWQKIFNFCYKFPKRKTVFSLAIIASLSLGWAAGYHSSINVRPSENETVEATKN